MADKNNENPVQSSKPVGKFTRNFSILKLIVLVLLIATLISVLSGHAPKTFAGLLRILQETPSVSFDWLAIEEVALELPDWLAWLNVVINFFADVVEILGFFLAGIGQAMLIVVYFLKWLFL